MPGSSLQQMQRPPIWLRPARRPAAAVVLPLPYTDDVYGYMRYADTGG